MLMAQRSDRTRCKVEENKKSESGRETFLADWEEAIHHWSFLNLAQNAGLQQFFKTHFSKLYLNTIWQILEGHCFFSTHFFEELETWRIVLDVPISFRADSIHLNISFWAFTSLAKYQEQPPHHSVISGIQQHYDNRWRWLWCNGPLQPRQHHHHQQQQQQRTSSAWTTTVWSWAASTPAIVSKTWATPWLVVFNVHNDEDALS